MLLKIFSYFCLRGIKNVQATSQLQFVAYFEEICSQNYFYFFLVIASTDLNVSVYESQSDWISVSHCVYYTFYSTVDLIFKEIKMSKCKLGIFILSIQILHQHCSAQAEQEAILNMLCNLTDYTVIQKNCKKQDGFSGSLQKLAIQAVYFNDSLSRRHLFWKDSLTFSLCLMSVGPLMCFKHSNYLDALILN